MTVFTQWFGKDDYVATAYDRSVYIENVVEVYESDANITFLELKDDISNNSIFISYAKKTKRNKPYRNKTWAKVWEVNHNHDYWSEKQIEEKKLMFSQLQLLRTAAWELWNASWQL